MIEALLVGLTRFIVGGHAIWLGGEPDQRQRIYFANHSSHLDTLLIWAALSRALRRSVHPVAAADYWGKPGLKSWVAHRVLRAVLVERASGPPGGTKGDALAPLRAKLADGGSLILFPEGTRGHERLPAPFKSGLFHLAAAFPDVELVPVYLENPARAFPKGAWLPVPISCSAYFGTPLSLKDGEGKAEFLDRARSALAELAP